MTKGKKKPMNTLAPSKDTTNKPPTPQTEEGKLIRELRGERSYRDFETYLNDKISDPILSTSMTLISGFIVHLPIATATRSA